MFKSLARKPRGKFVAVADIGGGSASVAIVATSVEGPARIMAAERMSLPIQERSAEATAASVFTQIGEASQKALSAFTGRGSTEAPITSSYAVLRAPWTHSKSACAESRLEAPTRIDNAMLSSLAQQALANEKDLDQNDIMEASIVRVELNGYPTAKPIGKHAQHVAVYSLYSESATDFRAGISEALGRAFNCPPPTLRSGTRSILAILRESNMLTKDCVVVSITSDGTSMMAIRDGVVAETSLLAEGAHSIVQRIAGEKMPEETLALIRMLALDQCDQEACKAIEAAMASTEPILVKAFGEAMTAMGAIRRLPNELILFAHEDLLPWLTRFFSRIDFAQFTQTTRPFVPKTLASAHLLELVTADSGVAHDIDLTIACALVNIEERP